MRARGRFKKAINVRPSDDSQMCRRQRRNGVVTVVAVEFELAAEFAAVQKYDDLEYFIVIVDLDSSIIYSL